MIVQYPSEIAADSPVAYWRFSETSGATVADSSGNSRTITLLSGYTRNVAELLFNPTAADKAVTLTGAGISTTGFWTTTTGASVSLMYKPTSITGTQDFLEAGTFGSSSVGYHAFQYVGATNSFRWYLNKTTGGFFDSASVSFTPVVGQTYHLAVTHNYTSGVISFYVDGVLIGAVTLAVTVVALTNRAINLFANLTATIDEFAVFSSVLSATRVKAQFAASRGADAAATIYYVSNSGSIYARGTKLDVALGTVEDRLDLAAALKFGLVKGGDRIKLANGTYSGTFIVYVSGTNNTTGRVWIEPESVGLGGVKIVATDQPGAVWNPVGAYTTTSRLDIARQWLTRTTTTASTSLAMILNGSGQPLGGAAFYDYGNYNNCVNCFLHDALGEGITSFNAATNADYYGNLIFNNGWYAPRVVDGATPEANGHGIYADNTQPSFKKLRSNIWSNAYASPIKFAGSDMATEENYTLERNLTINGNNPNNIAAGSNGMRNMTIDRLYTKNSDTWLYFAGTGATNAEINNTFTNSYLHGAGIAFKLRSVRSLTMTGNTILGTSSSERSILLRDEFVAYSLASIIINNNTYYNDRNVAGGNFKYGYYDAAVQNEIVTTDTFANYQTATGWDAASTYNTTQKPAVNQVFVESQGEFNANFGYIAVYNWANAANQVISSAELATIMASGTSYEIHSVVNFYGGAGTNGAIATGTWTTGGTITLPLKNVANGGTLPNTAPPYGDSLRNPELTDFAAFMIVPISAAPSSVTVNFYGSSSGFSG